MVRRTCPNERVLTWFDWGEYAIWHLSPAGIRVSMDGRRETIYSRQVLEDHRAFYNNDRSALDYPDRINAECIWLPTRLGTVAALQGRAGRSWRGPRPRRSFGARRASGSRRPSPTRTGPECFRDREPTATTDCHHVMLRVLKVLTVLRVLVLGVLEG